MDVTDEMVEAFCDAEAMDPARTRDGLAAVLALVERDRAADLERIKVLISAIDNALCTGSYMTGGNLALMKLCLRLGIDENTIPPFDKWWPRQAPDGGP